VINLRCDASSHLLIRFKLSGLSRVRSFLLNFNLLLFNFNLVCASWSASSKLVCAKIQYNSFRSSVFNIDGLTEHHLSVLERFLHRKEANTFQSLYPGSREVAICVHSL